MNLQKNIWLLITISILLIGCEDKPSPSSESGLSVTPLAFGDGISPQDGVDTYFLIPRPNSLTFVFDTLTPIGVNGPGDDCGSLNEFAIGYRVFVREGPDVTRTNFDAIAVIDDVGQLPLGLEMGDSIEISLSSSGALVSGASDPNQALRPWTNGSITIENDKEYSVMLILDFVVGNFFGGRCSDPKEIGWETITNATPNGENCPAGAECGACSDEGAFDYCTATPNYPLITGFQNIGVGDQTLIYLWDDTLSGESNFNIYVSTSPNRIDSNSELQNTTHNPPNFLVFPVSANTTSAVIFSPDIINGTPYFATISGSFGSEVTRGGDPSPIPIGPHTPALAVISSQGNTSRLNDTGINWRASGDTNFLPSGGFNFQDGTFGRESDIIGISKAGAGRAGFDYTKIGPSGEGLPIGVTSWSCVKDNHSGLYWQNKNSLNGVPADTPNDSDDAFSWYDSNANTNAGNAGRELGIQSCFGHDGTTENACNTEAYSNRVNASSLCGFNDWRLPTRVEFSNILDYGRKLEETPSNPALAAIDGDFFPMISATHNYWTSSSNLNRTQEAWSFNLNLGNTEPRRKTNSRNVILVRGEIKE